MTKSLSPNQMKAQKMVIVEQNVYCCGCEKHLKRRITYFSKNYVKMLNDMFPGITLHEEDNDSHGICEKCNSKHYAEVLP